MLHFFFPASQPNDGLLDLVIFSSDLPILKTVGFLGKLGKMQLIFIIPT